MQVTAGLDDQHGEDDDNEQDADYQDEVCTVRCVCKFTRSDLVHFVRSTSGEYMLHMCIHASCVTRFELVLCCSHCTLDCLHTGASACQEEPDRQASAICIH